ncbi:MAG: glycosyltransferase family 2 protein [Streptosporangiaceae bacterium]|jgi:cellulose synthase/poly-beta-1,6-N-acetylglucosamine synthase-like glycosyltransferase
MPVVNVTWLSWLSMGIVGYYALLLTVQTARTLSRPLRRSRSGPDRRDPFMVLVIPARNEQAVIGQTLATLEALDYPDRLVLVMDDGSADATGQVASSFTWCGRVHVIRRDPAVAGRGKGAVLNHAFAVVSQMVADHDPRLRGRSADEVVVGVVDADGQLEASALTKVAPYFSGRRNARVGGVQIGVRIANATTNLLTWMQDIEFVGFSALVQDSRNSFGSVGLGGNGQFTRLSALQGLRRSPWTACLSEDLDLSLSLAEAGWEIRYCPRTFVAQQGLTRLAPLLRQRARWIQGHYQCWRHLSSIWGSRNLPWRAKLDLSAYLMMILFIFVVTAGFLITALSWAGVVVPVNTALDGITIPYLRSAVELVLAVGPLAAFLVIYQLRAATRLSWWELPAAAALFTAFAALIWSCGQAWALTRIVTGRGSWAKTPRVRAEIAVPMASSAPVR